jgi:WD40 repeat protein
VTGATLHTLTKHKDCIRAVATDVAGDYFVTGGNDALACLWGKDGNFLGEFKGHTDRVYAVAMSKDGKLVLASAGNQAYLFDREKQSLLYELKGHSKRIASVALSNDRTFAVTGSWDYTVRIWPMLSLEQLQTLHPNQIILLAKVSELARKGKKFSLTVKTQAETGENRTLFASLPMNIQTALAGLVENQ